MNIFRILRTIVYIVYIYPYFNPFTATFSLLLLAISLTTNFTFAVKVMVSLATCLFLAKKYIPINIQMNIFNKIFSLLDKPFLNEPDFRAGKNTSLHIAAWCGFTDIALALIAANPTILPRKNQYGNNALHVAAWFGHTQIVLAILAKYPDLLFSVNYDNEFALLCAAKNGHKKTALAIMAATPTLIPSVELLDQIENANNGTFDEIIDYNGLPRLFNSELYAALLAASFGHRRTAFAIINAAITRMPIINYDARKALGYAIDHNHNEIAIEIIIAMNKSKTEIDLSQIKFSSHMKNILIKKLQQNKNIIHINFDRSNFTTDHSIDFFQINLQRIFQRNIKCVNKCINDILYSTKNHDGTNKIKTTFTTSEYQYIKEARALIKHRLVEECGSEAAADKILTAIDTSFAEDFSTIVAIHNGRPFDLQKWKNKYQAKHFTEKPLAAALRCDAAARTALSVPHVNHIIASFLGEDELEQLLLFNIKKPIPAIIVSDFQKDNSSLLSKIVTRFTRHKSS